MAAGLFVPTSADRALTLACAASSNDMKIPQRVAFAFDGSDKAVPAPV